MSEPERKERRYAAIAPLLVRCDSWGDFVQLYAADVSQGGMFILTDDPPPLLSPIDVKMGLPEGHEVTLKGRVVHVIPPELARAEGRSAGVGVEFQEVEPELKLQIHHLIEFARWEGSNPNASFSRHLAEVSMSQPPARVLESLAPGAGTRASAPPGSSAPAGASDARESTAQTVTRRRDKPRSDTSFSSSALAMPIGDLDLDARSASSVPVPPTSSAPTRASVEPASVAPPREPATAPRDTMTLPTPEDTGSIRTSMAPKGTDAVGLKVGMTHISYKRYSQAVKSFEEMVKKNPEDREARKWLCLAQARQCLTKNNEAGAAQAYQAMLEIDETNREARKFVREYHVQKRLQSLPFGRYFSKKKP